MEQNDAELIQRVLQGDQDAFGPLVKKYQKGIHALVWRKIGDFHIAEEITQDVFLKAYRKLETLKDHNLFAGWLYVIAANLCSDWFRKNPPPEQSLEVTDMSEVNQVSYSRYVAAERASEADEARREVVKKLLQKLPESERTVMTLYYLGEMTIKMISEFLGVAPNTIKSRLNRARNRLKKEEDMIKQNLGSFQLPTHLTQNIMNEISRIVPAAPAASKPVGPWVFSGVSALLILLLMGVGTQYLSRFQKPYDLNATSERTVELIEAAFVLDSPANPAVRNQIGTSALPGKTPGAGQKPDAQLFAAGPIDEVDVGIPKPQWVQTNGPEGGFINTLFTTTHGDIYAGSYTNLYKLSADRQAWKLVLAGKPTSHTMQNLMTGGSSQQLAEREGTLYVATDTEVLTSTDEGETWNSLGAHPKGQPVGIVITDGASAADADVTLNLALGEGVFRSVDAGKSWIPLNDENLTEDQNIRAIAAVENTLFVGTDAGLYRHKGDTWEKVAIRPADMPENQSAIEALAVDEHRLYVAAGEEVTNQNQVGIQFKGGASWSLYRSTDQGDTWYAINPEESPEHEPITQMRKSSFELNFPSPGVTEIEILLPYIKLFAMKGKVVVVDGFGRHYHSSTNTGETWIVLDVEYGSGYHVPPPVLMMDANTFYKGTSNGVQRTTDGGKSWHSLNTGITDTTVLTLIAVKERLYANSVDGFVTSTDKGESWTPLPKGIDHGVFIEAFDGDLYVKRGNQMNSPSPLCTLSTENHGLSFIPDMPAFEKTDPHTADKLQKIMQEALNAQEGEAGQVDIDQLNKKLQELDIDQLNKDMQEAASADMESFFGSFAVSGDTYYVEYEQQLFKWKPGMTAWHNTGLRDNGEVNISFLLDYSLDVATIYERMRTLGFKIAVADSTVYVGKRDGHLFQSVDEGETWNDVTADLPFAFEEFKAIAFAGSTVYVATDKGVTYSSDGTHWHTATDAEGKTLVVAELAAEGTTLYGRTEQHVYLLKEGTHIWKQATPEIPGLVISFAVGDNTLYVGTTHRGVLRFTLDESF